MEKSASSALGQSLSEDDIRNIQHERVLPQRKGFKIEIIKCRILFRFVMKPVRKQQFYVSWR